MPTLSHVIVLVGRELSPYHASRFTWDQDTITAIELGEPATAVEGGALVVIPGLYNGHTHLGDSALPDGATGLTLEEAFFRPAGYKYRELAKLDPVKHLARVEDHLRYMARCGIVGHLDFREQGPEGAQLLRTASQNTGVDSIILNQFRESPFDAATLRANAAPLPEAWVRELHDMLAIADGFSESTMNDLTDPAWHQIRELTTAKNKLRAIHCLESETYRTTSQATVGAGDLTRALTRYDPHLVVHMTVANGEEVQLLSRSGKSAAINPRANANLGLPLPPVAALLRAPVNLLLGTDNGMLNSPNLFPELDFTYKLAKSQFGDALQPPPSAILQMATSNVHAVLGGHHCGRLETGLPASFAVLNFHAPHLRFSRHITASVVTRVTPDDVLGTWHRGRNLWQSPNWTP